MAKTHLDKSNESLTMIEMLMVKEAKELLKETVLKELDQEMTNVAIEAVKKFSNTEMAKQLTPFGEEIHIHFSKKVIERIKDTQTVVIHDKDK